MSCSQARVKVPGEVGFQSTGFVCSPHMEDEAMEEGWGVDVESSVQWFNLPLPPISKVIGGFCFITLKWG